MKYTLLPQNVLQNLSCMYHPNQARRRRLTLNFTLSFVLFSTVILDALLAYNFLLHLLCQDPTKLKSPQNVPFQLSCQKCHSCELKMNLARFARKVTN